MSGLGRARAESFKTMAQDGGPDGYTPPVLRALPPAATLRLGWAEAGVLLTFGAERAAADGAGSSGRCITTRSTANQKSASI